MPDLTMIQWALVAYLSLGALIVLIGAKAQKTDSKGEPWNPLMLLIAVLLWPVLFYLAARKGRL